MKDWILFCIFIPACYLLGSINFALIISSIKNKDIRSLGSGNPGTMNMLRSVGKTLGILTFLLDFAKGIASALIGMFVFQELSNIAPFVLGYSCMLGHIFPIFNKFKGGKGVATTLGVFAVTNPVSWAVAFTILLVYLKVAKAGFFGSLIAVYIPAITSVIVTSIFQKPFWYVAVIIAIAFIFTITFAHRANFKRFFTGKENSLSLFSSSPKDRDINGDDSNNSTTN